MANDIHRKVLDSDTGVELLVLDGSPVTVGLTAPKASMALDRTNSEAWLSQGAGAWTKFGLGSVSWASITGKPTDVAGFGITDVYTKTASDARYAALAHTHSFLTSRGNYVWLAATPSQNLESGDGLAASFVQAADGWPDYGTVIHARGYTGGGGGGLQLYIPYGSGYGGSSLRYRLADYSAGSGNPPWTAFKTLVDDINFPTTIFGAPISAVIAVASASSWFSPDSNVYSRIWQPNLLISGTYGGTYGTTITYLAKVVAGAWKALAGGTASAITTGEGRFAFSTAPATAVNDALSWTDRFTVTTAETYATGLLRSGGYVSFTGTVDDFYAWNSGPLNTTRDVSGGQYPAVMNSHTGWSFTSHDSYGGFRIWAQGYPVLWTGAFMVAQFTSANSYINSTNVYLGSTGSAVRVRNVLYFGPSASTYIYGTETGPVAYGTLRMGGARNGYTGFYFDDWSYYVMNHATIYGLYHASYGWRFRFSGGATAVNWDLLDIDNITPNKDVYINTQSLGYGLVGVYDSTKLQALFAMSNAYRMNPNGTVTSYNFYGLAWTYDYAGGGINTGYSLSHGLAVYANSVLRSYLGTAGIYTIGIVRADSYIQAGGALYSGTFVSAGSYLSAGSYIMLPPGQPLYFDGGGDTYAQEVSANLLRFVAGGAQRMTIGQGSYFGNYSDNTSTGGMVLYTSGSAVKGYVYWDSNGSGLLSDTGNWGVRINYGGGASPGGTLYGSWAITGAITLAAVSATTITASGDITAAADVKVTGAVTQKKGTSTYYDTPTVTVSSSAAPGSSSGYPTGHIWIQVTAPI